MSKGNDLVFPDIATGNGVSKGLTKRELFELGAMMALLSNPLIMTAEKFAGVADRVGGCAMITAVAKAHTDELLKEPEK